jgi:hypothetical protein
MNKLAIDIKIRRMSLWHSFYFNHDQKFSKYYQFKTNQRF